MTLSLWCLRMMFDRDAEIQGAALRDGTGAFRLPFCLGELPCRLSNLVLGNP